MREQIRFLDVEGWRRHHALTGESLHVHVNGVDVTKDCFRAIMHVDHIHGDVWRFKRDAAGRHYLDGTGRVAHEVLTGILVIEPGGPIR